ncbi:MAG: uracil-DNA glycosylase [Bacteroidota bacterium]
MQVKIEESWKQVLAEEFEQDYFKNLVSFVKQEYASQLIYPPAKQIFNAFEHCPFSKTKVVILGQDPYHGPAQAMGLCFSVNKGVAIPPSLVNIFKELKTDTGISPPAHGDLTHWADQGVLLLNTVLTVRAGQANSHQGKGWERFTDSVIRLLSEQKENLVFILWGSPAQRKGEIIDASRHLVLKSVHPSPLSVHRGFYGSKPFSQTNAWLHKHGQTEIDWQV